MRHKGLKAIKEPLDLGKALAMFGRIKKEHPACLEAARLGQRLVREIQHLHATLVDVRRGLPQSYAEYVDPARVDLALLRTVIRERSAAGD
jgi:hypothetical protein